VEIGDFTTVYSHIDISCAVKIGSHCIIGSGATINPGVTIGNGTIIGSGSVVVGDIPDNVIAAGVPARVIKVRAGS
jgi:maltose O-acetyltransferase